jgi:hypothetical protein
MSFLSLGLLKDEQESTPEQPSSVGGRQSSASSPQNGSGGAFASAEKAAGKMPGAVPESDAAQDDAEASTLPPAVEALRRKLADKAHTPTFRRAVSDGTPTFATFKFGYLPTRGLLYSTIGHELALFIIFMLVHYGFPALQSQKLISQLNSQDHVIYLPEMGGGKAGEQSPGGGPSAQPEQSAAPAHASKGFAYPAKQAILSNPPNPDNVFQTLQRPLVVHPAPLKKLVPLPNIVQLGETRLPNDLMAPKAAMPQLHVPPQAIKVKRDRFTHRDAPNRVPTNEPPQIVAKAEMPKLPAAEEPLPQTPKVQAPPKQEEQQQEVEKPAPKPIKVAAEKPGEKPVKDASPLSKAQVARMEMHGKAPEPLLSLSAMPAPPTPNVKLPNGEARGKFALAPGGTLNPNSLTPGKTNMPLSTIPGMGDKAQSANAATEVASNAGNGAGHNPTAGGGAANSKDGLGAGAAGVGFGSGNTVGQGAGGTGNGAGRGSSGQGAGATTGRGAGTGAGGGSGPGSGAFQGITIQGGEYGNTNSNSISIATSTDAPSYTIEKQDPYRMTVVATAKSGGGLPDFGVFRDGRVFTVYIPMKRTPDEEDPTWTLQYSLLHEDSASPMSEQTVLAPQPVAREWPEIAPALLKRYAQRQVVLYAVVDLEGKVGQITVKQTPDARVSQRIVDALSKWQFRPAQLNDKPVAVKVLIGIPL